MIPYSTNGDTWTFFMPETGKVIRISATDKRRTAIQEAVMKNNQEDLLSLLNMQEDEFIVDSVNKFVNTSFGNLKFEAVTKDNTTSYHVTYKTVALPEVLSNYLVKLYQEGCESFDHYFKFLDNILSNPFERARNELYTFLAARHLPITDRGTFIAYKGVRNDMYSVNGNKDTRVLSGTVNKGGHILNTPGAEITVVTEDVDSNCHNYCSCGLHVGTWEYASNFGSIVVAVEVNPADVVSVPLDCGCEKCRVSSYKVLQIITEQFSTTDVVVSNNEAKETNNKPRVGGVTADELVRKHGYKKLQDAIDRNIASHGGSTTIEQLRGSVGRCFRLKSSEIISILLHMGYVIGNTDLPVCRRTVKK